MNHDRAPSRKNQPTQADFGKNKRSFDQVMAVYRASQFTGIQATDYRHKSATTPNRATPTSVEFRIDCDICIRKKVPAGRMARFKAAYCYYDSENPIESEIVAEKVMGLKRHRIEQRLAARV